MIHVKIFLAVGLTNGAISVVTTENFDEVYHQRITKNVSITDIEYSSDSSFLACALDDQTLALFRSLDKLSPTTPMMSQSTDEDKVQMTTIQQEFKKWEYVGRHRSHLDKIVGLSFIGLGSAESPHRLFTIGRDRRIVEYDYANSAYLDGVQLKMHEKIERTAKPTSFVWTTQDNRAFFLVSNTEGKIRYWSGDSIICRSTTLAPSFGGDISHMIFTSFPRKAVIYATTANILGLILFPLTGNPHESMGLIAHPISINRLVISRDESRVLVTSGVDNYIGIFVSHPEHLEAASILAGREGDPFIAMLEGGELGTLYQEIVDYFYSSMLRVQGELTDKPHEIPQVVPIEEIVPLMCSLGYYPTQFESELLRNEIFFSKSVGEENEEGTKILDFQTFLRLFLNHRPVLPPSLDDIENVFQLLSGGSGSISSRDLFQILQSHGETMSMDEIDKCIETLVGQDLPANLSAIEFIEEFLGLQATEEEEIRDED